MRALRTDPTDPWHNVGSVATPHDGRDEIPWWRDVDHCRELARWLDDERVTSLNAGRMALHGTPSTHFGVHLERKVAALFALRLYRSAWANLDQIIAGIEIVDPLHPAIFRARLFRLVAMACTGYACCGRDEIDYWKDLARDLLPGGRQLLLDYDILAFVIASQVDVADDRVHECIATLRNGLSDAAEAEGALTDAWLGDGGMLETLSEASKRGRVRVSRRLSPFIFQRVGRESSGTRVLDQARLGFFRAFQRWETWALRRTAGRDMAQRYPRPHASRPGELDLVVSLPGLASCRKCPRCGRRRFFQLRMDARMFASAQLDSLASFLVQTNLPMDQT